MNASAISPAAVSSVEASLADATVAADPVVDESPAEEYVGPATLTLDDQQVPVEVTLRGAFQPIDGRFHWYGRIAATDALADVRSGARGTLTTPHGSAEAKLSDVDPWGRFRITGVGRPPF